MRAARPRLSGTSGQAAIEVLGVLPLALALVFGVVQALLAGYAGQLAGHAVESAAIALQRGAEVDDVEAAARAALPEWNERDVRVVVRGRRVTVRLRPPSLVPPLADALVAERTADAGPKP